MSTVHCPTCNAPIEVPDPPTTPTVECRVCYSIVPTSPEPPVATVAKPADTAAEPAEPPGYPVRPFQATTGGSPFGLVLALAAGMAGAVILSVVCGILGSFFWLVLIFPIIHGLAVGACAGLGARVAKYRRPTAVGAVGALAGLVSVFGLHFLDFLAFRLGPAAPAVDFWGFMDLRATEGVQIGKAGGGGNGMNLGYVGSIIYWSLEAIVTMIAAGAVAAAMSTGPFCDACNVWKVKRTLGPYTVEPAPAVAALAAGHPTAMVNPADVRKHITLGLYECPYCQDEAEIDVYLTGMQTEGSKMWNYQLFVTYPGEAAAEFDEVDERCQEQGLTKKKK